MSRRLREILRVTLLSALGWGLCGCSSLSQPASASFASVVIAGATEEEIREETVRVFTAEGWKDGHGADGELVFEREGSKFDHLAYGSPVLDLPVLNRVRAGVVPLADGTHRLQCQAYIVRDRGGLNMDDEIRLRKPRAGPYQTLLDKVAAYFIGKERK